MIIMKIKKSIIYDALSLIYKPFLMKNGVLLIFSVLYFLFFRKWLLSLFLFKRP